MVYYLKNKKVLSYKILGESKKKYIKKKLSMRNLMNRIIHFFLITIIKLFKTRNNNNKPFNDSI